MGWLNINGNWIGRHSGKLWSSYWKARKICLLGDSIARGVDSTGENKSVTQLISEALYGMPYTNLATPSDGSDEQLAKWNALTEEERQSFDYVINVSGNNDISYLSPIATSTAKYQATMDAIVADKKASCKVIVCTLTPAQSHYVEVYEGHDAEILANRQAMNDAIIGKGINRITGQDLICTAHTQLLDDGAYSPKEEYWANGIDDLHLNEAGRQVIANEIIKVMQYDAISSFYGSITGFTVTMVDTTKLLLNYTLSANSFTGVKIERSSNGVDFTVVGTMPKGVNEFLDFGLTMGTLYYYRIRGYKDDNYTAYSSVVSEETDSEMVDQSAWFTLAYWDQNVNAVWQAGEDRLICTGGGGGDVTRKNFFTVDHTYRISITVVHTSGALRVRDTTTLFTSVNSSGNTTVDVVATNTYFQLQGIPWTGQVTALSVKDITP